MYMWKSEVERALSLGIWTRSEIHMCKYTPYGYHNWNLIWNLKPNYSVILFDYVPFLMFMYSLHIFFYIFLIFLSSTLFRPITWQNKAFLACTSSVHLEQILISFSVKLLQRVAGVDNARQLFMLVQLQKVLYQRKVRVTHWLRLTTKNGRTDVSCLYILPWTWINASLTSLYMYEWDDAFQNLCCSGK